MDKTAANEEDKTLAWARWTVYTIAIATALAGVGGAIWWYAPAQGVEVEPARWEYQDGIDQPSPRRPPRVC